MFVTASSGSAFLNGQSGIVKRHIPCYHKKKFNFFGSSIVPLSNPEFFAKLYLGFQAEHYVAGELFSAGYECFKLPGDFGFDLMVTNQKELTQGDKNTKREFGLPYAVQVKSRRISLHNDHIEFGANDRPLLKCDFFLKKNEADVIIRDDRAFCVFVIFLEDSSSRHVRRHVAFWIHSKKISELREKKFLRQIEGKDHEQLELLSVRLLSKPIVKREKMIEQLMKENDVTEKGVRIIRKYLPNNLPSAWDASEYVALVDKDERPKKLNDNLLCIGNIGVVSGLFE